MLDNNASRGDFWMPLKDFINEYHVVVIVSTSPDKGNPDIVFPSQVSAQRQYTKAIICQIRFLEIFFR
jgi:hypothetical protein